MQCTKLVESDNTMIEIGIVDDHPVVRLALQQFFESCNDIHVAGQAQNTGEAFELLLNANLNVLILDIDLPGQSGLDVIGVFCRKAPKVGIIVFSGYPQEQYAVKLFRMGAKAYIPKNSELDVLVNAVRGVAAGRRFVLPCQAELMFPQSQSASSEPHTSLTDREMQVLLKLARGMHPNQIADHLCLSLKSVSTYRTRLLNKLDAASNAELTYYALKHKLLD
jgi:two-component system invasion response regulator UvrY